MKKYENASRQGSISSVIEERRYDFVHFECRDLCRWHGPQLSRYADVRKRRLKAFRKGALSLDRAFSYL
jgi:hypothetical protein